MDQIVEHALLFHIVQYLCVDLLANDNLQHYLTALQTRRSVPANTLSLQLTIVSLVASHLVWVNMAAGLPNHPRGKRRERIVHFDTDAMPLIAISLVLPGQPNRYQEVRAPTKSEEKDNVIGVLIV